MNAKNIKIESLRICIRRVDEAIFLLELARTRFSTTRWEPQPVREICRWFSNEIISLDGFIDSHWMKEVKSLTATNDFSRIIPLLQLKIRDLKNLRNKMIQLSNPTVANSNLCMCQYCVADRADEEDE
jgi:hypothetical protein